MSAELENDNTILVEVAYALPDRQFLVEISVPDNCTMYEAAKLSGVAEKFADIDLESMPMVVFGKAERDTKARVLKPGERVEIYRPLIADPKEVRKKRAAAAKAKREQ